MILAIMKLDCCTTLSAGDSSKAQVINTTGAAKGQRNSDHYDDEATTADSFSAPASATST